MSVVLRIRLVRTAVAPFLVAATLGAVTCSPGLAADAGVAKRPPVLTSGPAVPLSAAQRAAIEAKRAVTIVPAPIVEPARAKAPEVSTIPAATASPTRVALPPADESARASAGLMAPIVPRVDGQAVDAFLKALGYGVGSRAGLVKRADGVWVQAKVPASGGAR